MTSDTTVLYKVTEFYKPDHENGIIWNDKNLNIDWEAAPELSDKDRKLGGLMKYKTILVTGAGGYIGYILVNMLLKKNYNVIALDRFFFGNNLIKKKNLRVIVDDTRIFKIKNIKNIDVVIDLAAISNDPSGDLFPKATKDINYLAR